MSYDKTLNYKDVKKGEECKCPKCGNSFYVKGNVCYSCGKK